MRFEQQIPASLRACAGAALAFCLFASDPQCSLSNRPGARGKSDGAAYASSIDRTCAVPC